MTWREHFHATVVCAGALADCGEALSPGVDRGHFDTKDAKSPKVAKYVFGSSRGWLPAVSAANAPRPFFVPFVILVSFVSKCPRRAPALCPSGPEPGVVDSEPGAENPGRAKEPPRRFAATSITLGHYVPRRAKSSSGSSICLGAEIDVAVCGERAPSGSVGSRRAGWGPAGDWGRGCGCGAGMDSGSQGIASLCS